MGFLQVIFKGCQYFILRVELTKLHQEETGENVKFDNFSEMSLIVLFTVVCSAVACCYWNSVLRACYVFFSVRWRFGTFHRGITKPFL